MTSLNTSAGAAQAAPPGAKAAPQTRRRPWMLLAVLTVLVALAAAFADWLLVGRFVESTDDAYVGGEVTVIAPKVTGFIAQVMVQDNQAVRAGQVLLKLDGRDFDARLAQADADLLAAQAAAKELGAQQSLQGATIDERQADLQAANAELSRSQADRNRYRQLVKDQAVSDQLAEQADAAAAKAVAAVARSRAGVVAAQRQLDVLQAQQANASARIGAAQAARQTAELNLDYTTVRAPIDGYVSNRTARVGLLAGAGVAQLTVIPSRGLWVDANFKEDQLRHMRIGDAAEVSLDAFDGGPLRGHIESLAPATGATFSILPPENATGNFTKIVQRVPVRIRLDAPASSVEVLRAGLSATVKVHLDKNGG